jgi:hypothetical protein
MKCVSCGEPITWKKLGQYNVSRIGVCRRCESTYVQTLTPGIVWVSKDLIRKILDGTDGQPEIRVEREQIPNHPPDALDIKLALMIGESMLTSEEEINGTGAGTGPGADSGPRAYPTAP